VPRCLCGKCFARDPSPLSELDLLIRLGLAPLQQIVEQPGNHLVLRRTAGEANIHFHEILRRARLFGELRQSVARDGRIGIGAFNVNAMQQLVHRKDIAHRRHIAGHGAVTERDQQLGARPDLVQALNVFLRADRALDQRDVDIFGKFLCIHQRPVNNVDLANDRQRNAAGWSPG